MPRKPRPTAKPVSIRQVRADADLDKVLAETEAALLAGDLDQLQLLERNLPTRSARIAEVAAERLLAGRSQVPLWTFEVIGMFGGRRAATLLRRIARDARVVDIVRFGAQRRAGWPEIGEEKRRLDFLKSLQDPVGTLVAAADQGLSTWPPRLEVLEEVLGFLVLLPPDRQQRLVERVVETVDIRSGPLLGGLLQVASPAIQRFILAELVRVHVPGAAGPIDRFARTTADADLRAEATAALQRLQIQIVDPAARVEPMILPPVRSVHLSLLDGVGGQVIWVTRQLAEDVLWTANIFHNEESGIKGAYGTGTLSALAFEDMVEEFGQTSVPLVEVDLAAARGAIERALKVNAAVGNPVPPAFELWDMLLHDTFPPVAGETLVRPELDDEPFRKRADLRRQADALPYQAAFDSWGFEPGETLAAMLLVPPPPDGRLSDRQRKPMIRELVTPSVKDRLVHRLRRQAWLLDRLKRPQDRDLALAAAAELANKSARPEDSRFLHALIDRSVAQVVSGLAF